MDWNYKWGKKPYSMLQIYFPTDYLEWEVCIITPKNHSIRLHTHTHTHTPRSAFLLRPTWNHPDLENGRGKRDTHTRTETMPLYLTETFLLITLMCHRTSLYLERDSLHFSSSAAKSWWKHNRELRMKQHLYMSLRHWLVAQRRGKILGIVKHKVRSPHVN